MFKVRLMLYKSIVNKHRLQDSDRHKFIRQRKKILRSMSSQLKLKSVAA